MHAFNLQNKKASRVRTETKSMAKKCVKKVVLMVMMKYLFILVIVFTVQANDLTTPLSLYTSSHPIRLLHPYESLYDCLKTKLRYSMITYKYGSLMFAKYNTRSFFLCMYSHRKETDAEIYDLAKKCIEECFSKLKVPDFHAGTCLFDCFDRKIRMN
jgi:hypothetical protein